MLRLKSILISLCDIIIVILFNVLYKFTVNLDHYFGWNFNC